VISKNILRALVLLAAFMLSPAQAVVIGGWDVGAFASYDFFSTSGSLSFKNATGEDIAIGDTSVDSFVSASSAIATVGLTFAAGELVNGPGFDLVLFEIGDAESMTVTVNGIGLGSFTSSPVDPPESITGFSPSGEPLVLNAIGIDLNGIDLSGAGGVTVVLGVGLDQGSADFALAGALAPVPVPAAVWLFGSGLLGLAGVARRKK